MLYLVRGKNRDQDRCLRIHAESEQEAEQIGWKQGLFVTQVELIEKGSEHMSRLDHVVEWACQAWKSTPKNPLKCFGRSLSSGQTAALLMLGCATWVLNLRMFGFVHV